MAEEPVFIWYNVCLVEFTFNDTFGTSIASGLGSGVTYYEGIVDSKEPNKP